MMELSAPLGMSPSFESGSFESGSTVEAGDRAVPPIAPWLSVAMELPATEPHAMEAALGPKGDRATCHRPPANRAHFRSDSPASPARDAFATEAFAPEPLASENSLPENGVSDDRNAKPVPPKTAAPENGTAAAIAPSSSATDHFPNPLHLDFENLACFETVDRQFESLGIVMANAIALMPSNPAFPPQSGRIVLMDAPETGWLEVRFHRPVCRAIAAVTSTRRLAVTAYDGGDRPLAQSELPNANLARSDSPLPPNATLDLHARGIRRLLFSAFDGHFTLDDFQIYF